MALAAHNYESSHGSLPIGYRGLQLNYPGLPPCGILDNTGYPLGHTAFVYILPYLEDGVVYNAFNIVKLYVSPSNYTGISTRLSTYVCPTDTQAEPDPTGDIPVTQGSYGAVRGHLGDAGVQLGDRLHAPRSQRPLCQHVQLRAGRRGIQHRMVPRHLVGHRRPEQHVPVRRDVAVPQRAGGLEFHVQLDRRVLGRAAVDRQFLLAER